MDNVVYQTQIRNMASFTDENIQNVYDALANGSYKSIVLVLGAGISV